MSEWLTQKGGLGGSFFLNIIVLIIITIIINTIISKRIENLSPQPSLQKATNKSNFLRSCAILQFCAKCVKVPAREILGRAKGSTRGFKEKQTQFSSGRVPWKETVVPTHARIAGVAHFIALRWSRGLVQFTDLLVVGKKRFH